MATTDSTTHGNTGDHAGSVEEHPPDPTRPANRVVPAAVERRYLRIDDRYFFPDRTLAFIDQGRRIKVRTHNQEVLHSVVAIAQARGWSVVALSGTEEFRRGMWREAALRGIEASGYDPSDVEFQQVQRALARAQETMARQGEGQVSGQGQGQETESPAARAGSDDTEDQDRRPARDAVRPPIKGVLLAAAAAPYLFDPAQRMSFYVTVQTEVGERTVWGVDLERALAESSSQPRLGDQVVLSQRGARPVTVRVPARNADGDLVGDRKIAAQRASWTAEKPEFLEMLARKAALVRSGDLASGGALARYPELSGAAAALKLARQFVQRVSSDAASQDKLLEAIRDRMAEAFEQGRRIRLPARRAHAPPPHQRGRARRNRDDPAHERI